MQQILTFIYYFKKYLIIFFLFTLQISAVSQKAKVYKILQQYFGAFTLDAKIDSLKKIITGNNNIKIDKIAENSAVFMDFENKSKLSQFFYTTKITKNLLCFRSTITADSINKTNDTLDQIQLYIYFPYKTCLKKELKLLSKKLRNHSTIFFIT